MNSTDTPVAAEAETLSDTVSEDTPIISKLNRSSLFIIVALVFSMPLLFGSVHPKTYHFIHFILLLLAALHCLFNYKRAAALFSFKIPFFPIFLCLFIFLAYSLIHYFGHFTIGILHPSHGQISANMSSELFWKAVSKLFFFISVFFVTYLVLSSSQKSRSNIKAALISSAFLVSMIGLSHWFSDNGKLFWFFEPEHVFVSPRARWPFVNSNHLAHFLLPAFFLLLGQLMIFLNSMNSPQKHATSRRKATLSRLIILPSFQESLIKIAFAIVLFISITLCITATLSRGSWMALSLGSMAFLLLEKFIIRKKVKSSDDLLLQNKSEKSSKKSKQVRKEEFRSSNPERKHRRSKRVKLDPAQTEEVFRLPLLTQRITRPVIFFVAITLFLFFLAGQGAELVEGRIEYGLKYSKDDMRWTFFSDTLPIIKKHLVFGTGLGTWSSIYPQYMNELLTDIRPAYLHSDPLQLLTESGLAGFFPILLALGLLTAAMIKRISTANYENAVLSLSLFCGVLAVVLASLTDFPFRIPAVSFCFSVYLAYLTYSLQEISCIIRKREVT